MTRALDWGDIIETTTYTGFYNVFVTECSVVTFLYIGHLCVSKLIQFSILSNSFVIIYIYE